MSVTVLVAGFGYILWNLVITGSGWSLTEELFPLFA